MARPVGISIVAALFMAQALITLAWVVQSLKSLPVTMLAAGLAGAAFQALTAAGLLRMRKWGRNLAVAMCGLMVAAGLWIRAAGAPPAAVVPMLLTSGAVIVYLLSSPARLRFT